MSTANVQDIALKQENATEQGSSASSPATSGKQRKWPRIRGLRFKLIFPYMVLTIFLAALGIFIITNLAVSSERSRFNNTMMDASRVANDEMINQEKNQLEKLRYVIFAEGMAQAMYDRNSDQIYNLMRPILANSNINLISAIDTQGHEIVTFGKDSNSSEYYRQENVDFSGVASVQKVLSGVTDSQGDKFAELLTSSQGSVLLTVAPVRDADNRLVGAMMVGTYIQDILYQLKQQSLADIILVDPKGKVIGTTLTGKEEGFQDLLDTAVNLKPDEKTISSEVLLDQRHSQVAYSPLMIRGVQVGWIGVIKSSEYIRNYAEQSRNFFLGLFTLSALIMLVIGYLQAQDILQPILKLRSMSQRVAAGDLNQKVDLKRKDEIGELGEAFDTMTAQLRERTEEAERLYAETLQRNRELAEINARLESTQLQLIQSEKLAGIGQLTAGIVHDVKNPFAVIMGMAEVIAEDNTVNETTRHGLKVIRESAVKGNAIVSDLLKFARQSKPEMRMMDLRETVQAAIRLTAYLTRRYNTDFVLPDTPLYAIYDAQLIEQVLVNMIQNAVQAMPDGGSLRIALQQVDETAHILLQDTGCGIAPEHLNRIFDPFFTTKPEGEGTGLGLSVSYGIVASHRGHIEVESEVGKGSTFTIVLPLTQPEVVREASL